MILRKEEDGFWVEHKRKLRGRVCSSGRGRPFPPESSPSSRSTRCLMLPAKPSPAFRHLPSKEEKSPTPNKWEPHQKPFFHPITCDQHERLPTCLGKYKVKIVDLVRCNSHTSKLSTIILLSILKWNLNNHNSPPGKQSRQSSWSCSPGVGSHRAWPDRPRSCSPSTRPPDSPVQWPSWQSQLFGSILTWITTCCFESDRESRGSCHRVSIHVRDPALSRCHAERCWPGQAMRIFPINERNSFFALRHASYKYQQHILNGRNSKKGKAEGRTWGKKITCDKSQEATQLQEVQCDLLDWHIHLPSSARYHDYKFVQRPRQEPIHLPKGRLWPTSQLWFVVTKF